MWLCLTKIFTRIVHCCDFFNGLLSASNFPKDPSEIIRIAKADDAPGNSACIPEALGRQMFDPSKPADISGRWTMLDPYFKTSSAAGHSDPASGFAAMLVENAAIV